METILPRGFGIDFLSRRKPRQIDCHSEAVIHDRKSTAALVPAIYWFQFPDAPVLIEFHLEGKVLRCVADEGEPESPCIPVAQLLMKKDESLGLGEFAVRAFPGIEIGEPAISRMEAKVDGGKMVGISFRGAG
jgi:hypothetical protein